LIQSVFDSINNFISKNIKVQFKNLCLLKKNIVTNKTTIADLIFF